MNIITHMDPAFYKAAAEGKINPFKDYQDPLNCLLTPNRNTILHVHLSNQRGKLESTDFVHQILDMCQPLLFQPNIKDEIPLHIAARYGHSNVVNLLIRYTKFLDEEDIESGEIAAKQMLRMKNIEKDTALHEAARKNHLDVVKILTKEDPGFSYPPNDWGQTPLYIAAREGYFNVVSEILESRTSDPRGGPGGRTALHAAVMSFDEETIKQILQKTQNLTKEIDQNGWSPLHYAAYLGMSSISSLLLGFDPSVAYIADKDKKRTALHMAAIKGKIEIMEEMVSLCPDCCELVDNRGCNALHYAVVSKSEKLFERCLANSWLCRLINEKDHRGNTPLHLFAASHSFVPSFIGEIHDVNLRARNKQDQSFYDLIYEIPKSKKEILETLKDASSALLGGQEINMRAPKMKIIKEEIEAKHKRMNEMLAKASSSHLVVAALIATVTFTAAFTLPGGFKNENRPDQGTAILVRNVAFMTFVITNALAMVVSLSAVFIHFIMALPFKKGSVIPLLEYAFYFTMIAMGAVVIAFITGMLAVLGPSLGLAIATCFIGFSFFFLVFYILKKTFT